MIKKIILATIAVLVVSGGYARDLSGETRTTAHSLYKPSAANPARTMLNIGNWGYWNRDNGESAHAPNGDSGGFFPRGTAAAIYLDGVLVGGYQNGLLRVSGQSHFMGTEPGYIQDGQHMTPGLDPRVRIYRIRKDYATLTADQVRKDAMELNELAGLGDVTQTHIDGVLDQYKADWDEWPTGIGAPFYDLNNNGVYEPALGETPGIANADQVVWYVITDADKGTTNGFYGTDPIGVEIQMTLWAYNQPGGGLGQLVFKQIRIINKGDGDLLDAYITLFSDPDVGDYANDLIGMDIDLSMMYVYNGEATDIQYDPFGLAPPAAGYDFFAGPIVESPGDTAIFDLQRRPGYRNLPASSFGYYGDAENDDPQPQGEVEAARKYYNLMRGFRPFDDLDNPIPWLDENGDPSKFIYAGDPVTGVGHLDSSPGDRRMLMSSGPFILAEGDTQDVVVAVVGGMGDNNLSSITAMKNNDVVAQQLFDDLFQSVPASPPPPTVKVTPLESTVVIDWSDADAVLATESSEIAGYAFQGYNIYQLPNASASKDQAVRVATFDLDDGVQTVYGNVFLPEYGENVNIPVQFGADSGIKRSIIIEKNHLTGTPLILGSDYYFAVTAYNYNGAPTLIEDMALETSLTAIFTTMTPAPVGTEYGASSGDAIEVSHAGPSAGKVYATVVDPSLLTGHDYEVTFAADGTYDVTDATTGTKKAEGVSQVLNNKDFDQPIIDGIQIQVVGPAIGIDPKRIGVAYGEGSGTSATYLQGWDFAGDRWVGGRAKGWIGLFGGLGNGFDFWGSSLYNGPDYVDVYMEWAACDGCTEGMTVAEMAAQSMSEYPGRWQKAVSQDHTAGYAQQLVDVPFTIWDIDVDPKRQLKAGILEGPANGYWDMGWDPVTGAFAANGGLEYIFILNDDYDEDYTDYLNWTYDASGWADGAPVLYVISPQARGSRAYLHALFEMWIFAARANTDKDTFTFTAPENAESDALAKEAVKLINVYPNPYYAGHSAETNRFDNFVTFTHLPPKAKLRIFSLDGKIVRELDKNTESQYFDWDLRNHTDLPVASGMYIVHIDLDIGDQDLGEKILKVFVVQPNQVVQYY